VVEEMLHMALACNLLNAVGGSPQIDSAAFVPNYPARLPGGLRPDLTVSLKRASIEHIRDVFMAIEEPETFSDGVKEHKLTVGWFYSQIQTGLEALFAQGPLFVESSPQLTKWRGPGQVFPVLDLESANAAIKVIVEQGEGAPPFDAGEGGAELAHFYKFEQIVQGRSLEPKSGGYGYTGAPVPFEPEGVWPMVDHPNTAALPEGSLVRKLSEQFDEQYRLLLRLLQRAFTSHPDDYIDESIEMMFSMEVAAKGLMQMPIGPGATLTAGPSFRWPGG
jgi:hypothetical protein